MSAADAAMDAEQALLGAMMLSPTAMWAALDIVTPADFLDGKHETIATTIAAIGHQGHQADPVTVIDELLKTGAIQRVPADYVFSLTSKPSTPTMAAYYAEIVQRHAALRRAARAATILGQGVADGRDVLALVDEARAVLDQVGDTRGTIDPIGTFFHDLTVDLDHAPHYHPTPWPHLNNYLHGLMPGAVYVVAARPGAGKTIAALQIAVELCKHGTVAFHSLEMPKEQLLRRLIASQASVSLTSLARHTVSSDEWRRIAPVRNQIEEMPLYIDDRSGVSMTQIESYARQVARKGQLAGLVVDYLQLIPSRDTRQSRWEHVGEMTRGFKLLAKDLNVPVILLSQLNRESEKNRRLPTLADLRESGSIEQDADVVLMLQRRLDKDGEPIDELDVVIAKNRHGSQGRIELGWEGKYARLVPMRWGTPAVDFAAMQAGADR